MGVTVYYLVLAAVIVLGLVMPQSGKQKKNYIITMAVIHAFVSGFRYKLLTGDLQKYACSFLASGKQKWFSDEILNGGKNFLFYLFLKAVNFFTNENFQIVLIIIAVIIEVAVAFIVYKHSPSPWLSYLIWNCFSFYIFGFNAMKQSFAMAFVMLAFSAIMDKKPVKFTVWMLIAGSIHFPAFVFFPAYFISRRKISIKFLTVYVALAILVFAFRVQIVDFIKDFYYEESIEFEDSGGIGGRFIMMCAILFAGIMLKGLNGKKFSTLFHIIAIAAILQIFSSFDNIFTRLSDYYFQMSIIFIPMIFTDFDDEAYPDSLSNKRLYFGTKVKKLLIIALAALSVWFYYYTCLSVKITYAPDDYLNYRFCWEVDESIWEEAKNGFLKTIPEETTTNFNGEF